ncbi:Hypothetical predicted protein [Cloeon dipterum]|uniref:Charged multivesicular body protein 1b n=1 Tax=Cloeon dipterum TaxID=197152 RepID=A0A8S1BWH4_9INSE|nr:Hypothetical predicted protein [Cloeon dipterum]
MKGSLVSRVIFSLSTFMVALPFSALSYQLKNGKHLHKGYYDSTAQFVPSAAHQSYQQSQNHPQRHGSRAVAANNWVPRAAPYYQPQSNQHYSNHEDTQATYNEPQEHTPQPSRHEQLSADSHNSPSWGGADESSHDGSRVHFHVNGHKGPKSYRFGYDTGKGKARQFRYEERDNHGVVHGRYGYHDKHGKMHVFHYSAHPHHGYQAKEVDPHNKHSILPLAPQLAENNIICNLSLNSLTFETSLGQQHIRGHHVVVCYGEEPFQPEEEKAEKLKCKKAIQKGNLEGARIHAENAIRQKNQALNYLRMSARVDAVASRVQTALTTRKVTQSMAGVVKAMDSAMKSMNLEKISTLMDKFEHQFEDLDVQSSYMENAMSQTTTTTVPQNDVESLMMQVADEAGLELKMELPQEQLGTIGASTQVSQEQDELTQRLARLRQV